MSATQILLAFKYTYILPFIQVVSKKHLIQTYCEPSTTGGKKGNLFVATTGFARGSKSPCPVCRRRGVGAGESYNSTVFVQFYCNV